MKFYSLFAVLLLLDVVAAAQQASAPPTAAAEQHRAWRSAHALEVMDDYGQLTRYRDADAALKPPAAGEERVVFFGDSITDAWKLDQYFPGKPYINRGISAQTTPQMLVRFREDVVSLQPRVVVILAGTNDIAGNTGPESLEDIEANYASFADLARAGNIRIVFASVLPVHNYTPESQEAFAERPPEKIRALNTWIANFCSAHDLVYLDYFAALVDSKGLLKRELADDGLHPNDAGYRIMAPLASAAIAKALR